MPLRWWQERSPRLSLRPSGPVTDGTDEGVTARWLPRLRESDWVLPASLARDDVVPTWTALGVVDGPVTSTVDPRGLVTTLDAYSLDWWVGADDRWYLPAREPGVTQVRMEHAPVVETTMRVPGGEVVHRAFAARGGKWFGGDDWVVVEVENRSALPVVLAWAVRPFSPTSVSGTQTMGVEPAAGVAPGANGPQVVTAWGEPLGVLPRLPSRWARAVDGQDVSSVVMAGEARSGPVTPVAGEGGDFEDGPDCEVATMALLVPLPHTATARILLLPHGAHPDAADGAGDEEGRTTVAWPGDLPAAEAVARGWSSLVAEGPRVEVPDPVLSDAVEAARRSVLLAHRVEREPAADDRQAPDATHRITTRGGWDRRPDPVLDQMEVLTALARWGHHDAADRALISWPEGQQKGGGFGSVEATVAALEALAAHAVAAGDAGPARAWLPEVGGAIEWLGRRARRPAPDDDPVLVAAGLDAASVVLALVGQPDAAAAVLGAAPVVPATTSAPSTELETELDAPSVTPREVAAAAVAATRAGGEASAVWALLRRASATWTWSDPERWSGDDLLVPARLLTAVGRMLVDDRPDGLALTTWMPPAWWGLGWEVHGVPTRWGRISYAVRWHSGRPALLWELGPALDGIAGAPVLTAPGIDPAWSSTERRGEALLAAVAPPPEVDAGPPVSSTGGAAVAAPPRSVWRPQDPGPDAPDAPDGSFS